MLPEYDVPECIEDFDPETEINEEIGKIIRKYPQISLHLIRHMREATLTQRTPAWLAARKNIITASDIAAVIGCNPYSNKMDVLHKKLGITKFSGNAATMHGNKHEDEAIRVYEKLSGNVVIPFDFGLQIHRTHPYVGGSPDGITLNHILVEIKCPFYRNCKLGYMPKYYVPQCQILMHIYDLHEAHYFEYWPESPFQSEEYNLVKLKRDPKYLETYGPRLKAFVDELIDHRAHLAKIGMERYCTLYLPIAERKKRNREPSEKKVTFDFIDEEEILEIDLFGDIISSDDEI